MNAITAYINDSLAELHKVRWPTRQQALRLSAITLGFTALASITFGLVDLLLNRLVTVLLSLT